MEHAHSHSHAHPPKNQGRLMWSLVLTGGFMVVEIFGGLLSGSLALLSDAGHMLSDTFSLTLAFWAMRIGVRAANAQRTYGNRRVETIIAFINGITLVIVAALIFKEGITRLFLPIYIHAEQMLWIAVFGLLVNITVAIILAKGASENLNIRGAFLHVLGDLLGSVGAIVAALVIKLTGWIYADPIVSLLIAALIFYSSLTFLGETWHILLEGTPSQVDMPLLETCILQVSGVTGFHDLHVWTLTGDQILLSVHIQVAAEIGSLPVLCAVRQMLEHEFGIGHCTLEPELVSCKNDCRSEDNHV